MARILTSFETISNLAAANPPLRAQPLVPEYRPLIRCLWTQVRQEH